MRRLLSRLQQDRRGVATVELALYAPMLAMITVGVIDMSNAFGRKLALEQATQRAIERVMQTSADATVEETIREEAADQANIPDDEVEEKVTVTFQLECDEEIQASFEDECGEGEDEARYLIVTVRDVYEPMFPLHFSGYDAGEGGYPITATAGMRTQ